MKGSTRFGPVLFLFLFLTSLRTRSCLASSLSANDSSTLVKTFRVFRSSLGTTLKLIKQPGPISRLVQNYRRLNEREGCLT